jgi:hypothetical protein
MFVKSGDDEIFRLPVNGQNRNYSLSHQYVVDTRDNALLRQHRNSRQYNVVSLTPSGTAFVTFIDVDASEEAEKIVEETINVHVPALVQKILANDENEHENDPNIDRVPPLNLT